MNNSYPAQIVRQIGSPCSSAGKESACNVGDLGLIPGFGRSPGEGKGNPLQYSDWTDRPTLSVTTLDQKFHLQVIKQLQIDGI